MRIESSSPYDRNRCMPLKMREGGGGGRWGIQLRMNMIDALRAMHVAAATCADAADSKDSGEALHIENAVDFIRERMWRAPGFLFFDGGC
jgi:hypothetical protein